MHSLRSQVRLAQRLHEAWRQGRKQRDNFEYAWGSASRVWNSLTTVKKQLQLAYSRGFQDCLSSLHEDYRWKLDELTRAIQSLKEIRGLPVHEPHLADWMHELTALADEFSSYTVDDKKSVLRVITEAITLKGIELGPFAIEFHWTRLANAKGSSCFDIIAVEPNPATGRDEINHPHVNDLEICAGDAGPPIERSLSEGRISEAFLMIHSVLTTYNPKSAYVSLEEWDGLCCGDCGGRVQREQSSYCSGCENDLCDSCASSCRTCEETRCCGCLNTCDGCRDFCCSRCLEEVDGGQSLCSSCRGVCTDCSIVMLISDLNDAGLCTECAVAAETPPTLPLEITYVS